MKPVEELFESFELHQSICGANRFALVFAMSATGSLSLAVSSYDSVADSFVRAPEFAWYSSNETAGIVPLEVPT
jgi:S-formylglutathione hydrolase FrmB